MVLFIMKLSEFINSSIFCRVHHSFQSTASRCLLQSTTKCVPSTLRGQMSIQDTLQPSTFRAQTYIQDNRQPILCGVHSSFQSMASRHLFRNTTKCAPSTLRGQMYIQDSLQPFYGEKDHTFSKSLTPVYNVFHLVATEIIFNGAPHRGSRLLIALISVALKNAPRCT